MPDLLPISLCVISGPEERRLGRMLESVAGWTSEIIVVLNEDVRDGTEEIALRHGARVFRERWKGHIDQKNSAAAKATQPWILSLDADEVVSAPLRAEIAALFGKPARLEGCNAFQFPRCTCFGGRWIRHGDWYPDRQTRLWRRGQARWGGINPHDKLEVAGRVGRLRGDLEHHSMETIEHQIRKALSYADDFARECAARGRRVSGVDLVFRPGWRFVRSYFLKVGFLDGWAGFEIAWMTAFYTFLRYRKARETQQRAEIS